MKKHRKVFWHTLMCEVLDVFNYIRKKVEHFGQDIEEERTDLSVDDKKLMQVTPNSDIIKSKKPNSEGKPEELVQRIPKEGKNLLDNKSWTKLVEEFCTMQKEFDDYSDRYDGESKEICEIASERIQEILVRNGLDSIDHADVFDIKLHKPVPFRQISHRTAVQKVIKPGLRLENRVFKKATVRL
ncbi:hypothetical protein OO006_07790 [Prosthecochloris sp. SCSIO W1101]|uniref:hypothetical protein n=1 Tax=Prosthecochloris sp. SCSIO W1101 TaxID=2992242 RepID=UPI00223D87AA|nr:hypothetical protein [Prosthecochloris sp. SCSIO W1101]UZJ40278.1 hypothetical protein OO006_07790 [Prosthecochloris sp. SCSIO W1101]